MSEYLTESEARAVARWDVVTEARAVARWDVGFNKLFRSFFCLSVLSGCCILCEIKCI